MLATGHDWDQGREALLCAVRGRNRRKSANGDDMRKWLGFDGRRTPKLSRTEPRRRPTVLELPRRLCQSASSATLCSCGQSHLACRGGSFPSRSLPDTCGLWAIYGSYPATSHATRVHHALARHHPHSSRLSDAADVALSLCISFSFSSPFPAVFIARPALHILVTQSHTHTRALHAMHTTASQPGPSAVQSPWGRGALPKTASSYLALEPWTPHSSKFRACPQLPVGVGVS